MSPVLPLTVYSIFCNTGHLGVCNTGHLGVGHKCYCLIKEPRERLWLGGTAYLLLAENPRFNASSSSYRSRQEEDVKGLILRPQEAAVCPSRQC